LTLLNGPHCLKKARPCSGRSCGQFCSLSGIDRVSQFCRWVIFDLKLRPSGNKGCHGIRGTFGQSERYRTHGKPPEYKAYRMTTKAELNRYFEMIDRRVPISVSQFIRWLRMPSSFAIRLVIAMLLILGGIFSFFPVLGLWMLPLGLLLIAQDVPPLQKPLVALFAWVEAKWEWLKVKWRSR
jgi:hypothetical protein